MKKAYGGVVINAEGRVLLREPAGHYNGQVWTFAKGGPDPGETPEQTALREVLEETGVRASIVEKLPGSFDGSSTSNEYFLMVPLEDTKKFDGETVSTRWVTKQEAKEMISLTVKPKRRRRELRVLKLAFRLHQRLKENGVAAPRTGNRRPQPVTGYTLTLMQPTASTGARTPAGAGAVCLSWMEEDFENRLGWFKAGRYSSPNKLLGLAFAAVLTAAFFALVFYVFSNTPWLQRFSLAFIRPRNLYTTVPALLLFFWAMMILFIKRRKIEFQARALDLAAVPQQPDFVLTEASAKAVLERIHDLVDHPRHFILLNRIERALSNLHNLGAVSEVSTILKDQAEIDENQIASSYTFVNGLVWSIPVLGFIGTVGGLSAGISNFAKTLQASGDLEAIKKGLEGVTSGLATGFETTLVALVCALLIQLYLHYLQQKEMEFMDQCNDYCQSYVISKLRLAERPPAP